MLRFKKGDCLSPPSQVSAQIPSISPVVPLSSLFSPESSLKSCLGTLVSRLTLVQSFCSYGFLNPFFV